MDTRYVAGYFDGEGWIGLYWNKGSKDPRYKSGRRGGCWVRTVGINNTYPHILRELHQEFGGSLRTMREKTPTSKKIYAWTTGSVKSIVKFLTSILPHLREKRPQAQLMLDCLNGNVAYEDATILLKEMKHVELE